MKKINDLKEYFGQENWPLNTEASISSKCILVEQLNKQISNIDCSTNVSQQLVNNLDIVNVEFNDAWYSVRSIVNEFLKFKEMNKILIRNMESVQKERSNQRGKIFSNFIARDAHDVSLYSISDFFHEDMRAQSSSKAAHSPYGRNAALVN